MLHVKNKNDNQTLVKKFPSVSTSTKACLTLVEVELQPSGIPVYRIVLLLLASGEIAWLSAKHGIDELKRVIRNTAQDFSGGRYH